MEKKERFYWRFWKYNLDCERIDRKVREGYRNDGGNERRDLDLRRRRVVGNEEKEEKSKGRDYGENWKVKWSEGLRDE